MQGLLKKRSPTGLWQARFAVLSSSSLSYWKTQEDVIRELPRGVISLANIQLVEQQDATRFRVVVVDRPNHGMRRSNNYLFEAKDEAERAAWLEALLGAVHCNEEKNASSQQPASPLSDSELYEVTSEGEEDDPPAPVFGAGVSAYYHQNETACDA